MNAAVELLRSLQASGCRLVIDDIGVHPINLELAGHVTPDFIKINKPQVCAGRVEGGVDALRSWIDVSRSLCGAVIADGIATESDLQISLSTGAHAAQGSFIDSLHKSPSWRATPLRVQDVFNPIYRDTAMKHYFSGGVGKR
jgi:EAL domain-containing protein (putative c-di-GMP-specific phosphodiesterase class I)